MTRLAQRKTRLTFVTEQTVRYRGVDREIVIEVFPHYATVRLSGTRTRYEISWRTIHDKAAQIFQVLTKERKKQERLSRRAA